MRNVLVLSFVVATLSACDKGSNRLSQFDMDTSDLADLSGYDRPPPPDGSCYQNTDCPEGKYCNWTPEHACGRDQTLGACIGVNNMACPNVPYYYVCGCDEGTYVSECHAQQRGIDIDYGGPCRPSSPDAGTLESCHVSADCVQDDNRVSKYCVDDPQDNCIPNGMSNGGCDSGTSADAGTTSCPGVCVRGMDYPCHSANDCVAPYSHTQACIVPIENECSSSDNPGRCMFTSGVSCESQSDCKAPELCMPLIGCIPSAETTCPSVCVRP
jgi:hypothetical protein